MYLRCMRIMTNILRVAANMWINYIAIKITEMGEKMLEIERKTVEKNKWGNVECAF